MCGLLDIKIVTVRYGCNTKFCRDGRYREKIRSRNPRVDVMNEGGYCGRMYILRETVWVMSTHQRGNGDSAKGSAERSVLDTAYGKS